VGIAYGPEDLLRLKAQAQQQLNELKEAKQNAPVETRHSMPSLANMREISRQNSGVPDILGNFYDTLGFSRILPGKAGKILKAVVLSRFMEPSSKRKASSILERRFGEVLPTDAIYRMMDVLVKKISTSNKIVFQATRQATEGKIDVVLFDVTTLHFESIEEDELRAFGFSKNFRFNTTQVVLALATTNTGLPIGYRLFSGNTAEVSTLIECVSLWKQDLSIGKVIMVGDRGMMSKDNLEKLENAGMQYILAYPMKKASKDLQGQILSGIAYKADIIQNELHWQREFETKPGQRLIVTYNQKRHAKDKKQRDHLIERIKKKIGVTKSAKRLVSNQGYLKYTKIENQFLAELNEQKIEEDAQWDGLHGILTNTDLSAKAVVERYKKLWIIEEAFRINKHNMEMRPIYHYTPKRILAHIEICFLTFALLRHAQERLKDAEYSISVDLLREELNAIEVSILCDQSSGKLYRLPSHMTEQGRVIYKIFGREQDLQIKPLENT
jgi:transposase